MSTITVEFEVPDDILTGLISGKYKLFGGVIRNAKSGKIVAHLLKGGKMSQSPSSGLGLLPTLLRAAGMNAKTVAVVAGAVTIAGPLLDVVIVGYTIHSLNQRIDALQKEIESIYDRLGMEFAKLKTAKLDAAQALAEKFLMVNNPVARQAMFAEVLAGLVAAEKTLLQDIIHSLDSNKLSLAESLMGCLMTVNTLAARCALDFDQHELALRGLEANRASLRPLVERLVRRLVRERPAVYFHKSVHEHYLDRYMQIRAWLDGDADIWERVAKEARKNFWDEEAIKRLKKITWIGPIKQEEWKRKPFYQTNIQRAELLLENYERFESYALYLKDSDTPFDDLEHLSEEAAKRLADHDDYALLVDECALRREGRLSA